MNVLVDSIPCLDAIKLPNPYVLNCNTLIKDNVTGLSASFVLMRLEDAPDPKTVINVQAQVADSLSWDNVESTWNSFGVIGISFSESMYVRNVLRVVDDRLAEEDTLCVVVLSSRGYLHRKRKPLDVNGLRTGTPDVREDLQWFTDLDLLQTDPEWGLNNIQGINEADYIWPDNANDFENSIKDLSRNNVWDEDSRFDEDTNLQDFSLIAEQALLPLDLEVVHW